MSISTYPHMSLAYKDFMDRVRDAAAEANSNKELSNEESIAKAMAEMEARYTGDLK